MMKIFQNLIFPVNFFVRQDLVLGERNQTFMKRKENLFYAKIKL